MNSRVYMRKKVTVAGVPVTVTVAGHELAIQVGRFDPQAAAGRLRVSRLSGTAAVAVHVAGEGGPDRTGERWVAGLYPAAPGAAERLLLCDGCFQAATGLAAFVRTDTSCLPVWTAILGLEPGDLFARTGRTRRAGVIRAKERQDVCRGRRPAIPLCAGAVRTGEHRPWRIWGGVESRKQVVPKHPNETTGLLAGCQDGCMRDLDHDGLCLRASPAECQWCGATGRLHEVPRAEVQHRLPTVGEEDEGMWHLHYADGAQGPFPSAQAAWDYRHAHGDGQTPVPSQAKPEEDAL